ncbi:MAG: glycerol-3-phosphate dehydrogenase/oxidase [Actinobacteria bacterium]|nr:glycerol-3-phosphate dehydrogenase/oxidase [Actinomycetota bacterium]
MSDRLDPEARSQSVAALRATTSARPLDVLVVGGGVVGCGAALDAVSRGLSVGLVERRDLGSGTSSRSSRLAHGGLRYLEQREFGLVHEALTERGLLVDRIAPHLVRPVPFLFPLSRKGWERRYVGAGIALYDLLSRVGAYGGTMPRPRTLTGEAAVKIAPGLNPDVVQGAVSFYDAQTDDVRHTIALARSAAVRGAVVASRCQVIGLHRNGEGRIVGARVRDLLAGEEFIVHARVVVGAAGVWSDQLRAMAGGESQGEVRQSKGVHLVVPRSAFASSSAVIARTPASVLFLLPWGNHWLVGTTDTDDDGSLDEPQVTSADVNYLLEQANRWLARPLTRTDVVGVYAGLRPLLQVGDADGATTTVSREHAVLRPTDGFVCVVGGKWTTYRVMAADVVDAAVTELVAADPERMVPPSMTADIPVVGAAGFHDAWDAREQIAAESDLSVASVEHLLRRHGDRIDRVLSLISQDATLGQLLHSDAPYLRAEVVIAVADEGAMSLEDTLVRRTRLALEVRDGGEAVAEATAGLMAPWLGWSNSEVDGALRDFRVSNRARAAMLRPEEV